MPKPTTPVDQKRLTDCIEVAEREGALPNLDTLWKKAAEFYNAEVPEGYVPITFSVALLRVKKWQSEGTFTYALKTQPGKVFRLPVIKDDPSEAFEPVTEEKVIDKEAAYQIMIDSTPERYKALAIKAKNSRKAAIKRHCLSCCGWSAKQVSACRATTCSFWTLRTVSKRGVKEEGENTPIKEPVVTA